MTTTKKSEQDERTRRWAAALRLGMAMAERADDIEGAAAVQVLDAERNVLCSAPIRDCVGDTEREDDRGAASIAREPGIDS